MCFVNGREKGCFRTFGSAREALSGRLCLFFFARVGWRDWKTATFFVGKTVEAEDRRIALPQSPCTYSSLQRSSRRWTKPKLTDMTHCILFSPRGLPKKQEWQSSISSILSRFWDTTLLTYKLFSQVTCLITIDVLALVFLAIYCWNTRAGANGVPLCSALCGFWGAQCVKQLKREVHAVWSCAEWLKLRQNGERPSTEINLFWS